MHATQLFETFCLHLIKLHPIGTPMRDCEAPSYTQAIYPGPESLYGVVRVQRSATAIRQDGDILYRAQFRLLSDLPYGFDPLRRVNQFDASEKLNTITAAYSAEKHRIRFADRADIIFSMAIRGRGVGGYLLACLIGILAERHTGSTVAPLRLSGVDSPTAFQRAIRNGFYRGRGFQCVPSVIPGDERTEETVICRLVPRWNDTKVEVISRDRVVCDPTFAAIRQQALTALDHDGEPSGHGSAGWPPSRRWN